MHYGLEIQKLLMQVADNINDDNFVISCLKRAIDIADKHGDIHWGLEMRYSIILLERSSSKATHSMQAFAWILKVTDEDPEYYEQEQYLLAYLWMFCSAYSNKNVPLVNILSIAEDLESRLDRYGMSKKGFYFSLSLFYQGIGDGQKSTKYLELGVKEPFDQEFDLVSQYDYQIENAAINTDFNKAIYLSDQMQALKLRSFCLPFASFCTLAYYLAIQRDPRSEYYLEKAKQELVGIKDINSSMLYSMTRYLYAMYLLDDPMLWSTYQSISSWEIDAEDDLRLFLSMHMASICKKTTCIELDISRQIPFYNNTGVYDTQVMQKYFYKQARDLALEFDKRNKNTFRSDELTKVLKN
ncbi:hypothetical protein [Myroides sp. LJL119]